MGSHALLLPTLTALSVTLMLPSQPTTRVENPSLLCSIFSPERPSCSEVTSQEELTGRLWLISSCTESSMTRRRPKRMRRLKKKLLLRKKLEMLLTLSTNSRKVVLKVKRTPRKKRKEATGEPTTSDLFPVSDAD